MRKENSFLIGLAIVIFVLLAFSFKFYDKESVKEGDFFENEKAKLLEENQQEFIKDSIAWENAFYENSLGALKKYQQDFPDGHFQEEAQFWISKMESLDELKIKLEKEDGLSLLNKRNILFFEITDINLLLMRGVPIGTEDIMEYVKSFILNPAQMPVYSADPSEALIIINNEGLNNAEDYKKIIFQIKMIYIQLWNDQSYRRYGKSFDLLSKEQKDNIRQRIPFRLLEGMDSPMMLPPPPPPVIEEVPDF